MPVVCFASPKGGVGKTTTALVFAGELREAGESVIMIDADPNHPLSDWFIDSGKPENLPVISDVTEENIIDVIEEAQQTHKFVIVDLEGTGSAMVGFAISRSNLVVIPLQGSHLDAKQALKAINLIRRNEKAFNKPINHCLLFTRTKSAISTRSYKHILKNFQDTEIDILESQLLERAAFETMFSLGGTLYDLTTKDVSNLEAARDNSNAIAFDILQRLANKSRTKRKAA